MTRNSDRNVIIRTILINFSPGTLALHQSQLSRLKDVNKDIRTSMEPLDQVPPQKVLVPKYPITVLSNYEKEIYPLSYWGSWEKFPLGDGIAEPWIDTKEFRRQLLEAGIDPNTDANRATLMTWSTAQTSVLQEGPDCPPKAKTQD